MSEGVAEHHWTSVAPSIKEITMKDESPRNEQKKTCSLVLVRNNKRLVGTAAQLAHISECGGWDVFLQSVAGRVIDSFAKSYNEAARTPRLRVVAPDGEEA